MGMGISTIGRVGAAPDLRPTESVQLIRRHFFLAGCIVVLVVMVLAAGARLVAGKAGAAAPGGRGGNATLVSVVAVAPHAFADDLELLGVAKGRQSVTLSAAATQIVDRVNFRDGQTVSKGAVLVELKSTEQDAGLAQAEARRVQAERAYQRWKTLGEKGFASKASVDEYEAAHRTAAADVDAARARIGDRQIRAPFAGVVGLSDIAAGALINPGAAIVTLDDVSSVRVDFPAPERQLSALREGQPITATVDAYPGLRISGRIVRLDTRVDERTRAVVARAEFPKPDRKLKPGMMIRVTVPYGRRQRLAAPEAAVMAHGDESFVYVIAKREGGMVAEQRPVVIGGREGGFVELRDGVAAGERLVANGLHKLQPDQRIRLADGADKPVAPR
jgi:membrane fusion protein (multidrug efflux system)